MASGKTRVTLWEPKGLTCEVINSLSSLTGSFWLSGWFSVAVTTPVRPRRPLIHLNLEGTFWFSVEELFGEIWKSQIASQMSFFICPLCHGGIEWSFQLFKPLSGVALRRKKRQPFSVCSGVWAALWETKKAMDCWLLLILSQHKQLLPI